MGIHGGDIYGKGKIIDFSSNINPMGIPPSAAEVLNRAELLTYYPDEDNSDIKESIACYLGAKSENVLVGNGLSEIIRLIIPGLKIINPIIIAPTFDEYRQAAMAYDVVPRMYFLNEDNDFEATIDLLDREFDAVFICNPNNPTGRLYSIEVMEELLSMVMERNAYLIVDEAFMEFCFDEGYTIINRLNKYGKIITLRAATKFFGMPGLRFGYAVSSPDVIYKLSKIQPSWPLNSFASNMSPIFKDREYIESTREWITKERPRMMEKLSMIRGVKVYHSNVNYFMLSLQSMNAAELKDKMLNKGFLIRDLSNIPGLSGKFIRVAVKTKEIDDMFLDALEVTING